MAIEQLRGFQKQTGGFGGFLGIDHEMADREQTPRSHELFRREVAPHFQGSMDRRQESYDRLKQTGWSALATQAQKTASEQYQQERELRKACMKVVPLEPAEPPYCRRQACQRAARCLDG